MIDYGYDKLIGSQIRNIRIEKGLTQDAFAAKLQTGGVDITRSALAKIEVGQRHIYAFEIKAIKDVLETTFEKLFP
ncbi:MAG: helix-turn-helix domain-containing protein [Clostridiales Family XIII bacterium]|jgi:transcriptional regulator with XRE-family HTH domain|nr:helix-turn-helix domain-containing protein [Clostridiales Family XIII bacterium]